MKFSIKDFFIFCAVLGTQLKSGNTVFAAIKDHNNCIAEKMNFSIKDLFSKCFGKFFLCVVLHETQNE